jgi:hypothetical protein
LNLRDTHKSRCRTITTSTTTTARTSNTPTEWNASGTQLYALSLRDDLVEQLAASDQLQHDEDLVNGASVVSPSQRNNARCAQTLVRDAKTSYSFTTCSCFTIFMMEIWHEQHHDGHTAQSQLDDKQRAAGTQGDAQHLLLDLRAHVLLLDLLLVQDLDGHALARLSIHGVLDPVAKHDPGYTSHAARAQQTAPPRNTMHTRHYV